MIGEIMPKSQIILVRFGLGVLVSSIKMDFSIFQRSPFWENIPVVILMIS